MVQSIESAAAAPRLLESASDSAAGPAYAKEGGSSVA
jgi:hypothetical protein